MKQPLRKSFLLIVFFIGLTASSGQAQTSSMRAKKPVPQAQSGAAKAATASAKSSQSVVEASSSMVVFASDQDKASMVAMEELQKFPGLNFVPLSGRGFYSVKAEQPETLVRVRAAYPELLFFTGMQLYALHESLQQTPEMAKAVQLMADKP